ncbi:MAG: hypothetical protein ACI9W4_002955 [Rhodothermales bacterium]|jgi:hypothetical protein
MKDNLNTSCPDWQAAMVDVLFGDATEAEAAILEEHLGECPECTAEYASLSDTLSLTASRPEPTFDESRLEALERRILVQTAAASSGIQVPANVYSLPRWTRQAASVAAVLVIGVLIGRSLPGGDLAVESASGTGTAALQLVVEDRAYDYLDRSRTVLLAVVNFDGSSEDPASLDLPQRSEIARELLQEADYLKTSLSNSDQQRLRALVSDLEVILLQLAHLEAQADIPEIEIVQSGVDQAGLLFKIEVEKMRKTSGPKRRPGLSV